MSYSVESKFLGIFSLGTRTLRPNESVLGRRHILGIPLQRAFSYRGNQLERKEYGVLLGPQTYATQEDANGHIKGAVWTGFFPVRHTFSRR